MNALLAVILATAPVVTGSLDKDVIRRVIHAKRPDVRACFEAAFARKPDIGGKVNVKFVISREGPVSSAEVTEDTTGDQALGECMVAAVKTWVFPKPKGGGVVVVNYPFTFSRAAP